MENKPNGCRISDPCTSFRPLHSYIIVHCQTRFDLLFSVTCSVLHENPTCSISIELITPGNTWKMDINGPGKSWKMHIRSWKVMEKPLSLFCTHPEISKLDSTGCSALPSPPRLMRRTHTA